MTMMQPWIRPEVQKAFAAAHHAVFNRSSFSTPSTYDDGAIYAHFARRYQSLCELPRRTRRALERTWKKPLAAIALLLTLGQGTALAATITVDANTPPPIQADGQCSLVEAILNANNDAAAHADCVAGNGVDTLVLPTGSVQTTSPVYGPNHNLGLPSIESQIVIEGRGSEIVGQADVGAVLDIGTSGTMTLNDTTISGNGIYNRGTLTLNRSTIARCYKTIGISNEGGTVTIVNSTVKHNYGYDGAGIWNGTNSRLILLNSTLQANTAGYGYVGGGIANHGTLTISHSRIIDNNAESGGGIANFGVATISYSTITGNATGPAFHYGGTGGGILNRGTLTISHSTIAGNIADQDYGGAGGGIYNNGGTLTVSNSTITGNVTRGWYGDDGSGGGIRNGSDRYGGTVTISNSTITGNSSDNGGGINVYMLASAQVTLSRTLVSGNTATVGAEIQNFGGTVVADDYNLIGQNGDAGSVGFTPGATDIVPTQTISQILLPLVNNGGKTRTHTHALAIGSPALDASPANEGCSAKDQRGVLRPRSTRCDIGAFEGSAVMCNGVVTTHVGTPGYDVILGTPGPDVISGLGSGDVIRGLDGDDMICGGKGNDRLVGGPGIDTLLGEAGDDVLLGQGDDDVLNGGVGTDQCNGGQNGAAGDVAAQCETVAEVP